MRPDTLLTLTSVWKVFLIMMITSVTAPESPVFDSIAQCCSLGEYRAKAQEEACDDLSVPATDIVPELQAGGNTTSRHFCVL